MESQFYSIGTYAHPSPDPISAAISKALLRIEGSRNKIGTWGGPDLLDEFIATCHCTMTLLAVGIRPENNLLTQPIAYLKNLDTTRYTTFFYRIGPLLNLPGYESLVSSDITYLLRTRERAGGHPNYPAPFFLLKSLRFKQPSEITTEAFTNTLDWIISDWNPKTCWNDRTSITSMGLALIADLPSIRKEIVSRSSSYLLSNFVSNKDRPQFNSNVIDDAFTVYNLYERYSDIQHLLPPELWEATESCAHGLMPKLEAFTTEEPPFGGTVDSPAYGIAVLCRALMAYKNATDPAQWKTDLLSSALETELEDVAHQIEVIRDMNSFWGPIVPTRGDHVFVLMPFAPKRTSEIYEEYVKKPLNDELGIACKRADNFYESSLIMSNIWREINAAKFIIADLTGRNPNVFYELGLAHVVGKDVILIAEKKDDIPFDLSGVRTIIYGDSPNSWKQLASDVVEYARQLT